jgi:hypothetical protein
MIGPRQSPYNHQETTHDTERRRGQEYPVAAAGETFNLTNGEVVSNQGGST